MPYLPIIESHLNRLYEAAAGLDSAMWPSVVDVRTGTYPEGDHAPRRVYRLIGAPRGSILYWDQPTVVAAHAVSGLTGDSRHQEAADAYMRSFLDCCVAANGMWQWGNHMYYSIPEQRVIEFHGGPHELRPLTPAWELFWRLDDAALSRYLPLMVDRHLYDKETGGFNRHDDSQRSHAFIEAGGILVESMAWLYGKSPEPEYLQTALRIARYSYQHRGQATGLVRNEPDHGRWDSKVCTTEIGLWAQCLLRASANTGEAAFAQMAQEAVSAYLRHGYDAAADRYYGQLDVETGQPVTPEKAGYWPDTHADAWTTDQWPTHDYPLSLAEACLSFHAQSGDSLFREAIERWARITMATRPGADDWAYAESYGRAIHVLTRASRQLQEPAWLADAQTLADEAIDRLYRQGMFQGYPDSNLYESVDGTGYLLLALLYLEAEVETDRYGFGF